MQPEAAPEQHLCYLPRERQVILTAKCALNPTAWRGPYSLGGVHLVHYFSALACLACGRHGCLPGNSSALVRRRPACTQYRLRGDWQYTSCALLKLLSAADGYPSARLHQCTCTHACSRGLRVVWPGPTQPLIVGTGTHTGCFTIAPLLSLKEHFHWLHVGKSAVRNLCADAWVPPRALAVLRNGN